jgi:hypothetical protein
VLLVRVAGRDHVDAYGHLARPEHMHPNLSDEAKDRVYEKLLCGNPARTIIDGTTCSCTVCSCIVAHVVATGK